MGHGEEVGGEGEEQRGLLRSLKGDEELEEAQLDSSRRTGHGVQGLPENLAGCSLTLCRHHLERERKDTGEERGEESNRAGKETLWRREG